MRSLRKMLPGALAVLLLAGTALACPNCKDAVAPGEGLDALSRAYCVSVLGMLAMPFLLMGGIGFALWRAGRPRIPADPSDPAEPTPGE